MSEGTRLSTPLTPKAFASTSGVKRLQRIQALTAISARALLADGACLILAQGTSDAARVSWYGLAAPVESAPVLGRLSLAEPLLVIENAASVDGGAPLAAAGIHFYASAAFSVDATTSGFLCVYGKDSRSISGAQEYVLRTLAGEIAVVCADESDDAVGTSDPEEAGQQKVRLRLLESVVVHANDAVLITEAEPVDLPGPRIIYANAAFTRMTGYGLDEIIGKTPRILHGHDTAPHIRRRLAEALHRWQPIEVELLNYRKDGTQFWVELSIVPVADETGFYTHWVSVQRDVTERKLAEDAAMRARVAEAENAVLAYRANHDDLTGLSNRSSFLERVGETIAASRRDPHARAAVLFLDLDRFKLVNDSLGHRVGDLLLIEVARRLRTCIDSVDTLARLGGDEFTCLLTGIDDSETALAVARRILAVLRKPVRLAGQAVSPAASIGISLMDGRYESAEDVLRDADTAMYRAKSDGGARFSVFDDSMHARALSILRAQMDLHGALERDQLVLHYQPILQTRSARIVAFEALVRWNHPERGLVPPSDFIPLAEEVGLIVDMGKWVLETACREARAWNEGRPASDLVTVNVNVSSRQLDDHDFFDILQGALASSGLDPRALKLELTESVFLEHQESVGALLERIRALGVRVALDDFGTGYSSLSYLERFRMDTLKIDRSFVMRLASSPTMIEIVRLIVGIAQALDMDVTAEGIENEAQRAVVDRCGCSHVQGFLFSRPLVSSAVAAFLERNERRPVLST
ncbi:MAG: EAL domain-containing protein [Candidatus Eremiobacteraeota bacterium]|nr:EAL domain-containing protein [Candidatus Eremiobacteraeota bacterium]